MNDSADSQSSPAQRRRGRRRILTAVILVVLIILALVLPPLINISRYQRRITEIVSRSFGRNVHLSGVELRLLPLPGFVLHDLTVAEDPAWGIEPILSARTVVANVDLFSLWRGKLQVSRVSVDEASLNLVRNDLGRWNLEALMLGPAQPALTGPASAATASQRKPFPYLEATNSRINLKQGYVKSPFAVTNSDLSLWQEQPGEWRLRLKGQPQRTDSNLSFEADNGTGEVRLEGTLHAAPQLRQVPVKLDLEWRDAQLGQLSRLALGSDAGWRGALLADLHIEGTAEALHTTARLRATGVRRAEFAPETALDFDANCAFVYQHDHNAFHQLACDTAVGSGHLAIKADLAGNGPATSQATLTAQQIPVQAGLDLLRSLRSGFAPGIEARGTINGSLLWQPIVPAPAPTPARRSSHAAAPAAPALPLTGSLTVENAELRGGLLKQPLTFPKITWAPTAGPDNQLLLATRFSLPLAAAATAAQPAGPSSALNIHSALALPGYHVELSGSAPTEQLRDLAYAFGLTTRDDADGFAGGTADWNLVSDGRWTPRESASSTEDSLTGSLTLHKTRWQAPWLRHPLDLAQATLTLAPGTLTLNSDFALNTIKGTAVVSGPLDCPQDSDTPCVPQIQLHFATLDAAILDTALLGAPEPKSLLSPLMDRMRSQQKPSWPVLKLSVSADALTLGSVTLRKLSADLHIHNGALTIDNLDAALLAGTTHLGGDLTSNGDLVSADLTADFRGLNPAQLAQLLGPPAPHWTGQGISGAAHFTATGATAHDLAASAKGTLSFDWQRGTATPDLPRFDRWTGSATFAAQSITLGTNQLFNGKAASHITGSIPFSGPVKLLLPTP